MAIKIRCHTHPSYRAIHVPKVMCNACWYLFHVATHVKQTEDVRLQIKRGKKWPRLKKVDNV